MWARTFFILFLTLLPSWSQNLRRTEEFRDQVIRDLGLAKLLEAGPGSTAKPGEAAPSVDDTTVLVPSLRGLILVTTQEAVAAKPIQFAEPKVDLRDPSIPPSVGGALQPLLGQPVTLALLNEASRTIVRVYRENDHPVVDAYLPEQNISGGVVQLVVVEGKLGEVRVEGAKHSKPQYLANQISINPGDPLLASVLDRDLDWLNDHPFRRVNLIYEPGETDGATDIVLQTQDLNPLRLQAGIANTGLDVTGETEANFGVTWGHVLGTEHLAAYQYSADIDFEKLDAHSLYYRAPLPWRHRLDVLAAYVDTNTGLDFEGTTLDMGGESSLVSLDYVIPLNPILGFERIDLKLGGDYKSTNNDIVFGGTSVFAETASVLQGRIGLEGERPDRWGSSGLGFSVILSPGNTIGDNDDESFETLRAGADPNYVYTRFIAERLFTLPRQWALTFSSQSQWTNSRLLSTEQLLAGGYRTVRGFDENLIRGDAGWLGSVELVAPPVSVVEFLGLPGTDSLQAALFYDASWLRIVDELPGETDQSLSSTGIEFNYRWGKNLVMRAGYGWQLNQDGVTEVEDSGKFHFGATFLY